VNYGYKEMSILEEIQEEAIVCKHCGRDLELVPTKQEVKLSTPSQLPGPTLKKRSVLLMILFFILTLAFYVPFWFVSRRKALNRLNPRYQVSLVLCILLFVIHAASLFVSGSQETVINLAWITVVLVLAFRVKAILNSTRFNRREEVSDVLTFFLHIFYLQYKINQLDEAQLGEQALATSQGNTVVPNSNT